MLRKFFYFFQVGLLSLISSVSFAQETQTSIPLQFNTGNPAPYGLPSTFIIIQGKKIPIILDTGAKDSEIVLSKHALKNIHVKFTGQSQCFHSMDGQYCEKMFIVPEIKLGSFVIKNVKGSMMSQLWGGDDGNFKETEASRNGVIGFALLSKFNLLLDYPRAEAFLIKRGEKPVDYDIAHWVSIPFNGHLSTRINLNGQLRVFSWDTGSIPSIIRKSTHDKITPCPRNLPYGKEDCRRVESTLLAVEKNSQLPKTWFKIANIPSYAPFDGLFGSNFYSENLVYFDFDHRKINVKHI